MDYDWDEAKRLRVLEKHGIDFLDVFEVLEGDFVEVTARDEGEARRCAVGPLGGAMIAVIFTMRGDVCRLITARRARRDERGAYLSRNG